MASMLYKLSNCFRNLIIKDTTSMTGVLVNYQPRRFRRRTSKAPVYYARKKNATRNINVTKENLESLNEMFNSSSPLKDELLSPQQMTRTESVVKAKDAKWKVHSRRTGVLAIKLGLIPQWTKEGKKINTTVLQVIDNHVIRYTPPEKYAQSLGHKPWWKGKWGSIVVGALSCNHMKFPKEYNNLFLEAGVAPKRKLTRFLISPNAALMPGTPLNVTHFRVNDYVDCNAKTIGRGFQGVVERWGFKGGRASHGGHKQFRKAGATGSGRTRSRVIPGRKMEGHMGMDWKCSRGQKILRIDTRLNVMYVKGTIPGPVHCYVRVFDTVLPNLRRRMLQDPPPYPGFDPDLGELLPKEIISDDLFNFCSPSIQYAKEEDK